MMTFEEWKKQYCVEINQKTLSDLKKLHNIKDPKEYIDNAQRNEYNKYCQNQYLKDNPNIVIQTEPIKSHKKDKLTLLGELLDPTVSKTEREHVAIEEIESLEALLIKHGFEIERLRKVAKKLKADIELQNKDWCDDDEAIKKQTLRVLPKETVEGDSVHVPRMGELAEMMADEIERLQAEIKKIHKDYGCEIRDPAGTIWDHAASLQNQIVEKDAEIHRLQKIVHKYKTGGLRK